MRSGANHRYGAVLVLTAAMATFTLAAPDAPGLRVVER
jgi:hypothetical protein